MTRTRLALVLLSGGLVGWTSYRSARRIVVEQIFSGPRRFDREQLVERLAERAEEWAAATGARGGIEFFMERLVQPRAAEVANG